ncbi:hypothetical protein OOK31_00055 [Streptomyces sp. NBC_00249]|uniref:hypothetical protein n=1 Tax=Streptomyces sp. NBC_00249 TaxID=2975690 RepID=UPI00224D9CBC|nr:hypothetical protein [Streptomyces sp. NBC_00249]MCX5192300.1 hypothetical protein [Streptomyces sp. NBC_00249]
MLNDNHMLVTLVDDRISGLSFPVGTKLSVRRPSLFELRDGLICREVSFEIWRPAGGETDRDEVPGNARPVFPDAS